MERRYSRHEKEQRCQRLAQLPEQSDRLLAPEHIPAANGTEDGTRDNRLDTGAPPPPQRQKYRDLDRRLDRLRGEYRNGQMTTDDYLGALGHLVHHYHRAGGSPRFDYPQRTVGCLPATQRKHQLHVCHCQSQRELC